LLPRHYITRQQPCQWATADYRVNARYASSVTPVGRSPWSARITNPA